MSMIIMKRKLKAKNRINKDQEATRGGISTNPGIFALNYTNTGKHLMGRTIPRYNGITSSYHTSAKYRRVYCCPNKEDYKMVKPCNPNTTGIKKVPFKQLSSRNYMRKRAYECGDGSCRSIDDDSLWKLSPEAHASSLTERLAAMALDSENGCIFNYKVTVVNDGGNKFVLDGNSGMNVQFKVGNTYVFDVSDSTNGAHPLRLVTIDDRTVNYDVLNIIGTQGEKNSKVVFKPTKKGNVLFNCTAHGVNMGSYYNGNSTNVSNNNIILVQVVPKTAAHTYLGTGSANGYLIDGVEGKVLNLIRGKTYRFDNSDPTNATHPLQFWSDAAKTGTQYTNTVTVVGTEGTVGAYVDFTVPANAPNKIFYQCGAHGYMGNYFNIFNKENIGVTILDSDENLIKDRKCYNVERSQNSLLRGRVGCGVMSMTKEVKNLRVAMDASDRIKQMKSRTLNATCITSIKPFNNKKCTPPA